MCKFERFSFDVACMQCGHPHSHQQVPFACIARARPVWIGPEARSLHNAVLSIFAIVAWWIPNNVEQPWPLFLTKFVRSTYSGILGDL